MAAETGFLIEGTIYEMPALDSMNMGEAQIFYDYSGLAIEDFAPLEDEETDEHEERVRGLMKNPAFWRAAMHIAYQRQHPELKQAKVRAVVDAVDQITARETLAAVEEEGEGVGPPASTTEPDASSQNDSVASNGTSGNDSPNVSDEPASTLPTIGTGRSDTSSPPSIRAISVP